MSRSTVSVRRRVVAAAVTVALALIPVSIAGPAAAAPGAVVAHLVDQYAQDVVGLEIVLRDVDTGDEYGQATDADGEISIVVPDGAYELVVSGWDTDDDQHTYLDYAVPFTASDGYVFTGGLVTPRYSDFVGRITNWTPSMIGVEVSAFRFDDPNWTPIGPVDVSDDGTFRVPAIFDAGTYTLLFELDPSSTARYLDAYLGGGLARPDALDLIEVTDPALDVGSLQMAMPKAALITGRVTDRVTGHGIEGILISALEMPFEDDLDFSAEGWTDADGDYRLRVAPGRTYAVYADDPDGDYAPMTFDGLYGCGCAYTPVTPTLTRSRVADFVMTRIDELAFVAGYLGRDPFELDGSPIEDAVVHVDARDGSGPWREVGVSDLEDGYFEVPVLVADASYRIRVEKDGRWVRIVDWAVARASDSEYVAGASAATTCTIEFGPVDGTWYADALLAFAFAGVDPSHSCGKVPGGGGSGGAPPTAPAPTSGATPTVPAAIPTPIPTATPTAAPSPTVTPTPQPTAAPSPAEASGADFGWLIAGALGALVLLALAAGAVFFARRR